MANPLKILTVLTASQAAQFKEAVELSGAVTARDGVTVSAGNVDVSAGNLSVVGNMSGSGTLQAGGAVTVAGVLTAQSASQFDSKITRGNDLRADALLGLLSPAAEVALSGTTLATSLIAYTVNGVSTNASVFRAYDMMNATKFYVSGASGNVSGSGTAQFAGAATLGNTLSVAGVATLSAGAALNAQKITGLADGTEATDAAAYGQVTGLSSSMKSYVDAADGVLSGAIAAEASRAIEAEGVLSGAIAAEALARVNEDLTFLKLDGSRAMSASLNMGGFDITSAKSGSFSGDVTVGGNLQVNGALTYINTTNLDVTDKLVTFAKGAVNAAAANGGGIELEGAGASLTYAETGDKWVSNKSFQVAADLFISGASDFSYINVARSAGQYDVDAAIQALDVAVSGAVNAGGNFKADYNARRHVATGNLSSGQAILNLTTLGGAEFAAGEISKIALDVMIDSDSTGYTNDLVAIKMFVDGADVKVQIDAPATPSAAYRLIAVNEEDIA